MRPKLYVFELFLKYVSIAVPGMVGTDAVVRKTVCERGIKKQE